MTDPGNMLTYKQFQWIVWNAELKCIEAGLEVENPKPMPGPIPPPLRMIEEWRERFFRNQEEYAKRERDALSEEASDS